MRSPHRRCRGLPCGALAVGLAACGGVPEAQPRPSVLVVTLDTTRADVLSPYGGAPEVSPVLGALADGGVRFTRAYTVTPLTIPAHSSLHTGQLPPQHGVRDNGDFRLGSDALTLAERFSAAGWSTMASVGAEVTRAHWGFGQGFDAYFDELPPDERGRRWQVERPAAAVVDDALDWLETASGPVFSWVHFFDAHHPYAPPPPFAERFGDRPYLGEIAYADAELGRLVRAFRARHPRSWIVVLADHGESLGEHGERFHGVLLYDPTVRIPLVLSGPEDLGGRAVDMPVSIVDIAPTLAELAGLPPVETAGRSLVPWLREGAPAARVDGSENDAGEAYVESLMGWRHYGWAPQRVLVRPEHKTFDGAPPRLYVAADRLERHDLAGEPDRAATIAADQARLDELGTGSPTTAAAGLSAEQSAQLVALGYLQPTGAAVEEVPWRSGLPQPRARLPVLAQVEAARQLLQAGDTAAASAQLDAVLEADPGLVEPARLRIHLALRQHRLTDARGWAEALVSRSRSSSSLQLLGSVWLQSGDPLRALPLFEEAVRLDPGFAPAWHGLLQARYQLGDGGGLAADTARAQEHLPDDPLIMGMTGLVLALGDDPGAARAALEQALDTDPGLPLLRHVLGVIALREGQPDEAESRLREELELRPSFVPARRALIGLLAEQKRYRDQLAELERMLPLLPEDPATAHSRAQALLNLGEVDAAAAEVERCRALAPRYPGCALLQANVLAAQGRMDAAKAVFAEAQALARELAETPAAGP